MKILNPNEIKRLVKSVGASYLLGSGKITPGQLHRIDSGLFKALNEGRMQQKAERFTVTGRDLFHECSHENFGYFLEFFPCLRCVCGRCIGGIGYFLAYANRVSRLRLSLLADDFRTVLAVKGLLRRALRHALDCCGPF
jgi:hypothetical protein